VYDYFPEAKATDLACYPSSGRIIDACFESVSPALTAESPAVSRRLDGGRSVLEDPEVQRRGPNRAADG
jgi:hypothetical protein